MPEAVSPAVLPARNASRDTLARRLTRTLILWVGSVWLICVLGVVWYVDREINNNFDNELVEISHRMFDIAVWELDGMEQTHPNAAPYTAARPLFIEDAVIYRITDRSGRSLLRSVGTNDAMFDVPLAPGFANVDDWRIFTVRHPSRALFFQVADPLGERSTALNRTLFGLVIPLVAVLALLGVLLTNIARSELRTLQKLEREIAHRSEVNLTPIALAGMPQELLSVGDHVNHLLERLAHALDVERALAANAAHELRTPLTAIRFHLQTALEHGLSREDVQAALDALVLLMQRTEKLLQLSRAEAGSTYGRAAVDLARMAAAVVQELRTEANAHRLRLIIGDGEMDAVAGDVDTLAIALRNLVENALRHGDGNVDVEVQAPATLIVRDDGAGVAPGALSALLRRHVRQSPDQAGYGLGLSIVSTIIRKHGAHLAIRSREDPAGRGFEACIVLPPADSALEH